MNLALWKERFREYMQLCGWSPRTVATYIYELGPLFSFLEAHGVDSVAAITQEVVEEYRTHLFYAEYRGNDPTLKGQRLSIRTQGTRLSAVKAFLRFLVCEHFLLVDVGAGVELPRTPRPLPRVLLSEREVERLMMAPDTSTPLGLRNRAILEVLYGTAIRNSELRYLTLDEVDTERRELRIQRGKGSKSRVVPLGEEALVWLEAYLVEARPKLVRTPSERLVFLTDGGLAFGRNTLSIMVRETARAARLKKHVTPHLLRHCCATHMLRHGAGIRHLQTLLGHESAATTQRYTKVEVSDLRAVLTKCHPRERKPLA